MKDVKIKLLDIHSVKGDTSEIIANAIQSSVRKYGITENVFAFVVTRQTPTLLAWFVEEEMTEL
jgi:hypothetical protein